MHSSLANHLHTDECNILIEAYRNCHKEYSFRKFIGQCNDFDRAINKCLHKERMAKKQANFIRKKRAPVPPLNF